MAVRAGTDNPRRPYRSPAREQRARRTRAAILAAAHDEFVAQGYAATALRRIADTAGVSVPTIEQVFGTKRALLKTVVDVTKAGDDDPRPLLHRAGARAAQAAPSAEEFLVLVCDEIGTVAARVSAIFEVVAHAAAGDREIAVLARELDQQRHDVARWVVQTVHGRGRLRSGSGVEEAVDATWVMLDPLVHRRLTHERGWSTEAFTAWLTETLGRQLLSPAR